MVFSVNIFVEIDKMIVINSYLCYTLHALDRRSVVRDQIIFKCSECSMENYIGTRNKKKHPEKMIVQKYCPKCNKKTAHKEKK